jgi:hypothetical protein
MHEVENRVDASTASYKPHRSHSLVLPPRRSLTSRLRLSSGPVLASQLPCSASNVTGVLSETETTQVDRSIADTKPTTFPANAVQLLHRHTPKDEQRAWERVWTGVRTIGVIVRSFNNNPSSCDDAVPQSCHLPCSARCMTKTCQPCQTIHQ